MHIYPTEVRFNIPALIKGMQAFWMPQDLELYDLIVVGQHKAQGSPADEATEGENPLRLMLIVKHKASGTLGVDAMDFSYQLLKDFELTGMAER